MNQIDQTIAALEEKLRQAKAKKQLVDARQRAADLKQRRADDTRMKILVGAVIFKMVERGDWPRERLMATMDRELTRDDDRALFKLKPVLSADVAKA